MMKLIVLSCMVFTFSAFNSLFAQTKNNLVEWKLTQHSSNNRELHLFLKAKIQKGFHLYALKNNERDLAATTIRISSSQPILNTYAFQKKALENKIPELGISTFIFENATEFPLIVSFDKSSNIPVRLSLKIKFSVCSKRVCFPPVEKNIEADFKLGGENKRFLQHIQYEYFLSTKGIQNG